MIKYHPAPDIEARIKEIKNRLVMEHVDLERVKCVRSRGSGSRRLLARCHALPRIMQFALDSKAHYVVEIVSEQFDSLSEEEQTKTLIHELMHIPAAFGGGFRHHRPYVNRRTVEAMYKKYMVMK
ncbi:MAG: metallopeptidase [Candidatus Aenigmarchaeota archaeon]|nr:metallopeptidase [Candidatus Aenigmarchaeota archaeon]